MSASIAAAIVNRIVRDLSDRRGLRHEWEQIDEDIQQEIREAWQEIIVQELAKPGPTGSEQPE